MHNSVMVFVGDFRFVRFSYSDCWIRRTCCSQTVIIRKSKQSHQRFTLPTDRPYYANWNEKLSGIWRVGNKTQLRLTTNDRLPCIVK